MVNKSNSPICQISLAGYSLRVSGLECPLVSASIHWWWCLCRSCVGPVQVCVCVCVVYVGLLATVARWLSVMARLRQSEDVQ